MKKRFFILFVFCPMLVLADDCSNAYKTGLELFKNGKFVEAQAKFIAVAGECGNYADVYNMIRLCNKKIANNQAQQTAEIASLKSENRKLTEDVEQEKGKKNNQNVELSKAVAQLQVLRSDTAVKNKELSKFKYQLQQFKDSIQQLQYDKDSIETSLESAQKQITMLQEELNNSSKKKKKKQSASPKKSKLIDSSNTKKK